MLAGLGLLSEGYIENKTVGVVRELREGRHVLAFNDTTDLRLETHVKHAVGLVEDKVPNIGEADAPTLNQIHKTSRGSARESQELQFRSRCESLLIVLCCGNVSEDAANGFECI